MAFLKFPIKWAEDDFETKEACGLPVNHTIGDITINTQQICAYNAMDNGSTLVRMANGDAYECPIDIEEFEDILLEVDSIIKIEATINSN
jgi:hypothetical protein